MTAAAPPPASIAILGGGTAGWMAACLMTKAWPTARITVVEAPEIGIVGVGEGSTPQLKALFDTLGIAEAEWMPAADATYKTGIAFHGWADDVPSYFHPFAGQIDLHTQGAFFASTQARRLGADVAAHPDRFFLNARLAAAGLAPIAPEHFPFRIGYGYHFDAHKVGAVLRGHALTRGVVHLARRVVNVAVAEGAVALLLLEGGDTVDAEVFVDASGFRSVIAGLSGFPCVGGHNGCEESPMSRRKEPTIPNELLDQLLAGGDASAAFAQGGLLGSLKKALTERALNAEMDHHLAGEDGAGNTRNGYGRKTVMTDTGKLAIDVPRDRQASFDPQLIAKYQRRFPGFDDKIVSMYARGMSTREIAGHLHDLYGIDVSPDLISTVTDAVLDEVATWQQRPLDPVYPLVFFDALRVKIRDEGMVRNKAIHIALGVRADGGKEVLGLWLEQNEGAKFWLRVMNELRNRGVEDILLAVVDGLRGFPDAITAVFPDAIVQTCIVHLLRNAMDFVSWKDRKGLATALKEIYRATDADTAEQALTAFEAGPWGSRYPAIGQSWRRAWTEVIPFFAFPDEVRRIIYTTNAIEALNSKLRRAIRARGHFPSDEAATKLLYLILNRSEKEWKMPPREWTMAKAQFAVIFGERFIRAMAA